MDKQIVFNKVCLNVYDAQWNIIQPLKGIWYYYMLQHK
jgi:hypothetical protein